MDGEHSGMSVVLETWCKLARATKFGSKAETDARCCNAMSRAL